MTYAVTSALAIYFVMWWIVLFVTLPFGVRSQMEGGASSDGTDPGAPMLSRMRAKLIWTTLLSAGLFAIGLAAYRAGYLNVERLTRWLGMPL